MLGVSSNVQCHQTIQAGVECLVVCVSCVVVVVVVMVKWYCVVLWYSCGVSVVPWCIGFKWGEMGETLRLNRKAQTGSMLVTGRDFQLFSNYL